MPYFKDVSEHLHFLSDEDILVGGEKYLPLGCVAISDIDAEALLNPPVTSNQLHEQLVREAKIALDATDMTALRCIKAGVAFPVEWQVYTTSLRNIVSGLDAASTSLPSKPPYPVGT